MKKEKNNIKFNDLFSEYEHRKGIREKEKVPKNKYDEDIHNVNGELFDNKNLSIISKAWSFLNTPLEELVNKKENKVSSLKILNEYRNVYDLFKVYKRNDIKINYKEVFKKMLWSSSSILMIIILLGIFFSQLLLLSFLVAYIAGMFLFYQQNDDLNGINEEIVFRKYKTVLTLFLHMKPALKSYSDVKKLLTVMTKNSDVNIPDNLVDKYSQMLWEYLSKVDEKNIPDLNNATEDYLLGVLIHNFKGLIENRNSEEETSKHWDNIIEIFTHEGIEKDLKTFENIDLLKQQN